MGKPGVNLGLTPSNGQTISVYPGTTLEWTGHGQAKFLISIPLRK